MPEEGRNSCNLGQVPTLNLTLGSEVLIGRDWFSFHQSANNLVFPHPLYNELSGYIYTIDALRDNWSRDEIGCKVDVAAELFRKGVIMTTANKIRDYVLNNLIEPARREGKRTITFKASEIHKAMKLQNSFALVCSSIDTDKFLNYAPGILVQRIGPLRSSTVQWTFDLKSEKRTSTFESIKPLIDNEPIPSPIGVYVGSERNLPPTKVQAEPVLTRTDALQKLIDIGFTDVGYWRLDGEGISFTLVENAKESSILYSFVVNGEVKYIGKSVQTLYKRMYLYKQGGSSQVTNKRNRQSIKTSLEKGYAVRIFAFVQRTPMAYKDMPINVSAGLEDNLISLLKPEWNKR